MPHTTILLIEDQEDDILSLRRAFEYWKVSNSLQVVTTGDEALCYLSGQGVYSNRTLHPLPSLILLDLNLPGLSGFGVLSWVRAQPEFKRVPIVVLSGSEVRRDIEQAYDLGANSFLIKGPDINKLVHQLFDLNKFVLAPINPNSVIHFTPPAE